MRDDVKQPTPSHMIFFDKLRYRLDGPIHTLYPSRMQSTV
jgi:hypothetical protein